MIAFDMLEEKAARCGISGGMIVEKIIGRKSQ